jgi:hypothetical protein
MRTQSLYMEALYPSEGSNSMQDDELLRDGVACLVVGVLGLVLVIVDIVVVMVR